MLRQIFRKIPRQDNKILVRTMADSEKGKFLEESVAYESEHYYKQDRELLGILKQKTQEEIKTMQNEVRAMRDKIEEYNRNINESIRFLKGLKRDLTASDKKS